MAHLAQVNAATLRYPVDDPRLAGFTAVVDRIHRLAETAPGFVWRHPDAHRHRYPDAELSNAGGAPLTVVNLSVWESYEALHAFTYRSVHGQLVRRRAEWFLPPGGATTALWWVPDHATPDPVVALARLRHLRRHGPGPRAFSVRRRFDPEGRPSQPGPSRKASTRGAS